MDASEGETAVLPLHVWCGRSGIDTLPVMGPTWDLRRTNRLSIIFSNYVKLKIIDQLFYTYVHIYTNTQVKTAASIFMLFIVKKNGFFSSVPVQM